MLQLRGSVHIEYTLARMGAERLWKLINEGGDSYVHALGALTGALEGYGRDVCVPKGPCSAPKAPTSSKRV